MHPVICFIISPHLPRTHNFLCTPLTLFNYARVNQTLYKPRENEITTGRPDRGVRTQARHRQDWPSGRQGRTCAPRSKGRSVIANRNRQLRSLRAISCARQILDLVSMTSSVSPSVAIFFVVALAGLIAFMTLFAEKLQYVYNQYVH